MERCPKCNSIECYQTNDGKQLRTLYTCSSCGHQWSRAGINLKGENTPKQKNPFIVPILCLAGMIVLTVFGLGFMGGTSSTDTATANADISETVNKSNIPSDEPTITESPIIMESASPTPTPIQTEMSKETPDSSSISSTPSASPEAASDPTATPEATVTPQPTSTPDDCGWVEDKNWDGGGYCSYHPEWYGLTSFDNATGQTTTSSVQQDQSSAGNNNFQTYDDPYQGTAQYIGNASSRKFHHSWCGSVSDMNPANRVEFYNREDAINSGYQPCKRCNP